MIRARILYFFALVFSLLLALGYGDGALGFTLFYALIVFFIISLVCALTVSSCVSLEESVSRQMVFKGESLIYTLDIKNRGIFPYPRAVCYLKTADVVGYGEARVFSPLGPLGKLHREYRLEFPYRGVYPVGVERLEITDFLGLFKRSIRPREALTATVYPQGDERFMLLLQSGPQRSAMTTDPFNEDYSSVADVRKYTTSDSLRKVHWKLSAKRGELMVKNFNAYEPDRTIFLLDTRALPLSPMERAAFEDGMVGCVAAATDRCLQSRQGGELIYGELDEDKTELGQWDDAAKVYELLAGIPFDGDESAVYAVSELSGPYNLVVFIALLDEAVHDALKELISFDHNLTLYCFFSPALPMTGEKEYLLASLEAYGARVSRVDLTPDEEPPQAATA